jgi:hypothetical protein
MRSRGMVSVESHIRVAQAEAFALCEELFVGPLVMGDQFLDTDPAEMLIDAVGVAPVPASSDRLEGSLLEHIIGGVDESQHSLLVIPSTPAPGTRR